MIKKIDLGAVSAYALAVEKGYEGTEEEFVEILTNALNYATQAQESASAAAGSAEEAGRYKTQAGEILASVNLAGTQQIEAIESAGTQQTNAAKEAIEVKGKETLDSIPDSYEALQGDVTQLRGDLGEISYTKKAANHIKLDDESYVNPSTLVREYDGENANLSFTEVVNPVICWWLNNLTSGKEYTLSFEVINGSINSANSSTQIRTWSNEGTGSAFLTGFTQDGNKYKATFTAPPLSESRPLIFRLQLIYNSKNVTISNVKCIETGDVDKTLINNTCIEGLEESNLSESLRNKISDVSSALPIKFSVFSKSAVTGYSGECILAKFPNGKNMLMDTHLSGYSNDVISFLRNHGISKIDYIMITHYHSDHVGGILKWIEDGKITDGKLDGDIDINGAFVYLPYTITTDIIAETYRTGENVDELVNRQNTIKNTLASNGCTIVIPTETDVVNIGDVTIRFWNTDHSVYSSVDGTSKTTNYNDFSLCCDIEYGCEIFTNTGDIGPIGQSVVGGKLRKSTIMTAPHHGWDNGVNNLIPAFINNVSPDVVISPNGQEHYPTSQLGANILNASSPMQTWCEKNNVRNYCSCFNGEINLKMYLMNWCFDYTDYSGTGKTVSYSHYIRNDKNWKYSDNSEYVES